METRGKCGVQYPGRPGEPPGTPRTQSLEWGFRDGGKPAAFKSLTVRNLIRRSRRWATLDFGDLWNSPLRLNRQRRAWTALHQAESSRIKANQGNSRPSTKPR